MKKILVLALAIIVLISLTACQSKSKEVSKTKSSVQKMESEKDEKQDTKPISQEEVVSILSDVAKKTKKLLIDNSRKIHPEFNMKDTQILLVSNIGKVSYLINSQNEKYGEKKDISELATNTIIDDNAKTAGFGSTTFNGKPTYFYNIDNQISMQTATSDGKEEKINHIIKMIVHEAAHLYLQPLLEKNKTVESIEQANGDGQRAVSYPIKYRDRIYRAQQAYYYRAAVKSKKQEERIANIKKANYFYEEFLKTSKGNTEKAVFDRIEGQPSYLEARALAILSNKNTDKLAFQTETVKHVLNDERVSDSIIKSGIEDMEYYSIGALAYTNAQQLGEMETVQKENKNPVQYLYDRYGSIKNEGEAAITEAIKNTFSARNEAVKKHIDSINAKKMSKDYYKVKVPMPRISSSFVMSMTPIVYTFKNKAVTIENISQEIKLGENRLKLTDAEVIRERNAKNEVLYLFVLKTDTETKAGKITIQTKSIQVFDQPFKQKGDELIL